MSTQAETASSRLAAKFPKLSGRGVLMGLGKAQVTLLFLAFGAVMGGFMLGPWLLWGPVIATSLVLVPTYFTGRPLVHWIPYGGLWVLRTVRGQRRYRVRPMRLRPAGTLALPGDAARLRVVVEPVTGAGLIHDPSKQTLTAIARVEPNDSFVLAEGDQQDLIGSVWGQLLAGYCEDTESGISRIGVLLRSISDGGEDVASWYEKEGSGRLSTEAHEMYGEYLKTSRTDSIRHESFVSLTLSMRAKKMGPTIRAAGGGVTGGAEVLRTRMSHLRTMLPGVSLTFKGWANSGDNGVIVRTAYDPDAQGALDAYPDVGRSLAGAGPMALDEAFTFFKTETGFQRVLMVREWPRSMTTAGFLQDLVVLGVRHTVALTFEPIPPRKALAEARQDATKAETSRRWERKSGAVDSTERQQERSALAREEEALEAGHGALRYAGLVTVSGHTLDELRRADEQVRTAAQRAGCELRVIGGDQASAFIAGALPFGRGI